MSEIYKKISDIMKEISFIGKGRKNNQQGYNFRGIDDLYNALHETLAKHEVFTTTEVLSERSEEKISKSGTALIYRILTIKFKFYTTDGSYVESVIVGEGMDSGDKASNKALSVAHKYALLQIFCIPTQEEKDPEIDSHELKVATLEIKKSIPQLITPAQLKRLFTICSEGKIEKDEAKNLIKQYGYESSKDIKIADYEKIIHDLEVIADMKKTINEGTI